MVNNLISKKTLFIFSFLSNAAFAEIDEIKLGKNMGYPECLELIYSEQCKVGSFTKPEVFPYLSKVQPSKNIVKLERYPNPPIIKIGGAIGSGTDIEKYLAKQRATGLMILKDGKVVVEKYQYDRTEDSRFRSFSMAKTITSLLVGIAIDKGFIDSIDDKAEKYVPEIQGTVYGEATVRNLLRMSSGANFNEDYKSGESDLAKFYDNLVFKSLQHNAIYFNKRVFPQGKKFKYSTADTEVLVRILAKATKRNLTDLTQDWLWDPIGAENAAYWILLRSDNLENGGGGFFATIKDYAKIGNLLANDGFLNNIQIVPRQYLLDATDSDLQPSGFKKNQAAYNFFGYGYQIWILPFKERTFVLQGIYGQNIFVQPSSKVVMVQTSVYEKPAEDPNWNSQLELFKAAVRIFGGNPS